MIIVLLFLFFLFSTPSLAIDSGWDYNLTKRCLKSPHPGEINYYQDLTQCGPDNKNWTVAVQSEKSLGVSCGGTNNQSVPVNTSDSPLSLDWIPHQDEQGRPNWQVNLTTDLTTKSHPCNGGNFTWYTLMDHVGLNGGPFVLPDKISTSVQVGLVQQNNQNVATRTFVAWQGFWDGRSHAIEINFNLNSNWGDANPDPDIIQIIKNDTVEYVVMNGKPLNLWLEVGETKTLTVKWIDIINSLIQRGYFSSPQNGWQNTATTALFVGSEVNNFTTTNAGKTILSISNYRNTTFLPADANSDSKTDLLDFAIWKKEYLGKVNTQSADFNHDNLVNLLDFGIWKKSYLLN